MYISNYINSVGIRPASYCLMYIRYFTSKKYFIKIENPTIRLQIGIHINFTILHHNGCVLIRVLNTVIFQLGKKYSK